MSFGFCHLNLQVTMLKKLKLPLTGHLLRELSLITILVSLGVTVFAFERQNTTANQSQLLAQVDTLNQRVEEIKFANDQLNEVNRLISTDSAVLANEDWQNAVELYTALEFKFKDYSQKGLDLKEYQDDVDSSLALLLKGKYDELATSVNDLNTQFEDLMAKKVEEDKQKAAEAVAKQATAAAQVSAPVSSSPGAGYSRITVQTEQGNFVTDLIMVDRGAVKVVTITGQDGNCDNNCITKPLAAYVAENSGFAGINGTYFCPPDYGSCAGKVNSFDFPVYNSVHNKWINEDKLFWSGRAMMAFSGSSARFCADSSGCDRGVISAGIVNYPALINNGHIVVNPDSLPDVLKNNRGYRWAIGVSGNWLYLMVVRGATVPHVAYVMKSLGIQNGMNLDGGGSTALYYNGYKLGPGRSLPNAVVLRY